MKPILEIQNVSKRFCIEKQRLPYLTLRERFSDLWRRQNKETFWALKDVSLNVRAGEALGIIGRNGAGKSTLLKILSRITPPTKGKIICRGRIASLLEVGTGFHQELTGRENVYMNASILGMKKAEVNARFDEIVDFSGVARFLDTPLKFYSSGMQLRLAFAVAAHLEPEILIVDEVLAVGDAEFQKKCLQKMANATGSGMTILFVSHNLPSLRAICKTGTLLRDGSIVQTGDIRNVIDAYLSYQRTMQSVVEAVHYFQPFIKIKELRINGVESTCIAVESQDLTISMVVDFSKRTPFELDVHIKKDDHVVVSYANFVKNSPEVFEARQYFIEYTVKLPALRSGKYKLDLYFTEPFVSWFAVLENTIELDVTNLQHHTFLNTPSLKWGSVLATGAVTREFMN